MNETVDISSVTPGATISIRYRNTNVQMSCTFVMASFDSHFNPNTITLSDFYN